MVGNQFANRGWYSHKLEEINTVLVSNFKTVQFAFGQDFQNQRNQSSLTELLEFVEKSYAPDGTQPNAVGGATYLPVGALLTGINKPDHSQYFKTFADIMTARNSGQVVVLPARDCSTMKSTIEALVSSIISSKYNFKDDDDEIEEVFHCLTVGQEVSV